MSQDKRTDNFSRRSFARARIGCRNFFFFFFCCSILGDRLCYRLRDFPVRGGTVWRPSLQWRQTSSQKRQLRQSGVNVRRVKVVLPHFQLRREREKEKVVSCVSLSLLVYSCCWFLSTNESATQQNSWHSCDWTCDRKVVTLAMTLRPCNQCCCRGRSLGCYHDGLVAKRWSFFSLSLSLSLFPFLSSLPFPSRSLEWVCLCGWKPKKKEREFWTGIRGWRGTSSSSYSIRLFFSHEST